MESQGQPAPRQWAIPKAPSKPYLNVGEVHNAIKAEISGENSHSVFIENIKEYKPYLENLEKVIPMLGFKDAMDLITDYPLLHAESKDNEVKDLNIRIDNVNNTAKAQDEVAFKIAVKKLLEFFI